MSNPLSGLKVDHWWHAFTVVGAFGMMVALATKNNVIGPRDALMFFLSLFLFGMGQWINHPIQVTLVPAGKITGYNRRTKPLGLCLEVIGCVIFAVEVYRIAFTK
jgi:hypothetical protein